MNKFRIIVNRYLMVSPNPWRANNKRHLQCLLPNRWSLNGSTNYFSNFVIIIENEICSVSIDINVKKHILLFTDLLSIIPLYVFQSQLLHKNQLPAVSKRAANFEASCVAHWTIGAGPGPGRCTRQRDYGNLRHQLKSALMITFSLET